MKSSHYDVLGIGAPIVDRIIHVSQDYLEKLPGAKGGSFPIDYRTLRQITQEDHQQSPLIPGGSTANTIRGLAKLEHSCVIFGRIGTDQAGNQFRESIISLGITSKLKEVEGPTAQALCLITPDSERTMRSYFETGNQLKPEDLTPELFQGVRLVHIEGYLLACEGVVERAMELAAQEGAEVTFDLSSFEIVAKHKTSIIRLLSNFVNIVFANSEEARALTGLAPEQGCKLLRDLSEIAIVKMGDKGGWAASGTSELFYPAFKAAVLDTTGAGDFFASGFLHGYLNNKGLVECTHYGALMASGVIENIGADISLQTWNKIKQQLTQIGHRL